jgi:hypothetical protein
MTFLAPFLSCNRQPKVSQQNIGCFDLLSNKLNAIDTSPVIVFCPASLRFAVIRA